MGKEYKFKVVEKLKKMLESAQSRFAKEMKKLDQFCYDLKSEKEAREALQARKSKTILEHIQQRTHKIFAEGEEEASILIMKRIMKEGFSIQFKKKCLELNLDNYDNYITETQLIPCN